jgi:tripartite-type tricarboxylate transporter receptor subunit TctC
MGQWLSERLAQSFVIENRPGASTNIAIETVAKAVADGYMLATIGTSAAISATLYDKLNCGDITGRTNPQQHHT